MSQIIVGAPSLNGKDANEKITENFVESDFPLTARFTNLVAHGLNFPEVSGLSLESCVDKDKSVAVVEIADLAAMQRLVSSIEQVAGLHNHAAMLIIERVEEDETSAYVLEQEALWGNEVIEPVVIESAIEPEVIPEPPVKKAVHTKKAK